MTSAIKPYMEYVDSPKTSWDLLRWILREPIALEKYDQALPIEGRAKAFFPLALRLLAIWLPSWFLVRVLMTDTSLVIWNSYALHLSLLIMCSTLIGCWIDLRAGGVLLLATLFTGFTFLGTEDFFVFMGGYRHIQKPLLCLTLVWMFRSLQGFLSIRKTAIASIWIALWLTGLSASMSTPFIVLLIVLLFAFLIGILMLIFTFFIKFFMKDVWAHFAAAQVVGGGLFTLCFFIAFCDTSSPQSYLSYIIVLVGGILLYCMVGLYPFVLIQKPSSWTFKNNPYLRHGYIGLLSQDVKAHFSQLAKQYPEKTQAFAEFLWQYRPMAQVFAYQLWETGRAAKLANGLKDVLNYRSGVLLSNVPSVLGTPNEWLRPYIASDGWENQLECVQRLYILYRQAENPIDQASKLDELAKGIEAFEYYNDQQHPNWREFYVEVIRAWEVEVRQLMQTTTIKA